MSYRHDRHDNERIFEKMGSVNFKNQISHHRKEKPTQIQEAHIESG